MTSKPGGSRGHPVAVAHPDRIALAFSPHALEQRALGDDLDLGAAELAVMAALDLAAELRRHRLLAVADAEHRHAGVEDVLRRPRRDRLGHRGRPAGEDDALRLHLAEGLLGRLERHDLGIDPLLAHPPRDELRHLRAEIDDEDLVVVGVSRAWVMVALRSGVRTANRDAGPERRTLFDKHFVRRHEVAANSLRAGRGRKQSCKPCEQHLRPDDAARRSRTAIPEQATARSRVRSTQTRTSSWSQESPPLSMTGAGAPARPLQTTSPGR